MRDVDGFLRDGETLEDLQINGAKIIQNHAYYTFANDPILLVNFARIKKNSVVVDLCSGSGIIALLVALKSQVNVVYGMEIQQVMADMAMRSVEINNLQNKVQIIQDRIQNYSTHLKKASVDVVFCNPPYFKVGSKKQCENDIKTIARHEVQVTLNEVVKVASELINSKGEFYLVHQVDRLQDICALCDKYKLAIKEMMLVQATQNKPPHLVLIKAVKDGANEVKILPNLILNNTNGSFTTKVIKMYATKDITKKSQT